MPNIRLDVQTIENLSLFRLLGYLEVNLPGIYLSLVGSCSDRSVKRRWKDSNGRLIFLNLFIWNIVAIFDYIFTLQQLPLFYLSSCWLDELLADPALLCYQLGLESALLVNTFGVNMLLSEIAVSGICVKRFEFIRKLRVWHGLHTCLKARGAISYVMMVNFWDLIDFIIISNWHHSLVRYICVVHRAFIGFKSVIWAVVVAHRDYWIRLNPLLIRGISGLHFLFQEWWDVLRQLGEVLVERLSRKFICRVFSTCTWPSLLQLGKALASVVDFRLEVKLLGLRLQLLDLLLSSLSTSRVSISHKTIRNTSLNNSSRYSGFKRLFNLNCFLLWLSIHILLSLHHRILLYGNDWPVR